MTQPFANVRVIDFSQVVAGPFATYQMALLGADVIKIERPGVGDDSRMLNSVTGPKGEATSTFFMSVNGNKRSIALDLKDPGSIDLCKKLVRTADVVVENFRPGVMDRLGLGYEALKAVNPKLIYCAVSGFGQTGPEAGTAAYDGKVQATSGLMSITGHPEKGPTRCGFAVVDAAAGMTAAFAISSALFQRTHTGEGQFIDVAMLDTALSFMSPTVCDWTVAGIELGQFGNTSVSRLPTADLFPVKDGHILMSCINEVQFQRLLPAIGREDLQSDPRFADWNTRCANADALQDIIREALADADAGTWEKRFDEAGVPAARIWSVAEAVDHPQLAHRDAVSRFNGGHDHEKGGDAATGGYSLVGAPFKFAHDGPALTSPPPKVGEHTRAILQDAGLARFEIDGLMKPKST